MYPLYKRTGSSQPKKKKKKKKERKKERKKENSLSLPGISLWPSSL
jgi:hypothetical protein